MKIKEISTFFNVFEKIPLYIYFVFLFLIALGITYIAYTLQVSYYTLHDFFLDPVFYHHYLIQLYDYTQNHSLFETIKFEFFHNSKSFFRTFPLLFFPKLLSYKYSFLITGLPLFYLFIGFLFYSIYRIQQHKLFAFSFIVLFLSSNFIVSPIYGITVFWLDLTAGFALALATMFNYLWYKEERTSDLYLFCIFSIISILCRDRIFIFLLAINFPIFLLILYKIFKKEIRKKHLIIIILFSSFILLPLIIRDCFFFNQGYIAAYGYGTKMGISDSLQVFSNVITHQFFSLKHLFFLVIMYILMFINSKKNTLNLLVFVYSILVVPFLMIIILQSTKAPHVYLGFIPVIFLFPLYFKLNNNILLIATCIVMLTYSMFNIYNNYDSISWRNNNPSTYSKDSKKITDMIVHKIQSNNTRWEAFHSEYLLVPNVTAFYEKGILYEPLNYKQMFTIHKTYFTSHHRTSDTKIISNYYLNNIDSYDFVVVADLEKIPFLFNNEISNAVSTAVTKKVKSSPDIWVLDTTILTSTYGKLSLYTNILNKNATFNNNN